MSDEDGGYDGVYGFVDEPHDNTGRVVIYKSVYKCPNGHRDFYFLHLQTPSLDLTLTKEDIIELRDRLDAFIKTEFPKSPIDPYNRFGEVINDE